MNYIWDVLIRAREAGIKRESISFVPAKSYSPYMELSLEHLNASLTESTVEVNPYYRFYSIFRDLFAPDIESDNELRTVLFDLVTHALADIDLMQGMNKREFYIRFVLDDLKKGAFGEQVRLNLPLFDREEQEVIACSLLRLYDTGDAMSVLRDTMKRIFSRSTIYGSFGEKNELLLYIGQEKNEPTSGKLAVITDLFLPIGVTTEVFWTHHFGILDIEDTMQVDQVALY